MAGITRKNLSQSVVDELLDAIRNGQYKPGDRLPVERELMEQFGVGRGAVREAVQSLVSMGLIEVRPRIGATVLSTTAAGAVDALAVGALLGDGALDDLYEFRQILEVEIAGRAATRAGEPELMEIGLTLDSFREALARDLPTFKRDIAFHQALAHASGNRVYADVLKALSGMLVEARAKTQAVPGAPQRAMEEHQEIYAAIMAGDEAGARAAMARHIESAKWALQESRRRQAQHEADAAEPPAPASDGPGPALVGPSA